MISLGYSGIKLDGILIPEPTKVPTEEPPAEEPVNEPPAEIPAEEPPAEVPAEEPPAEEPVNEPPAEIPAEEPPAEVPAEEPPVNEPPAEIPAEEPPAGEPPFHVSPTEIPTEEEPVKEPPHDLPGYGMPTEVLSYDPPDDPGSVKPVEPQKTPEPIYVIVTATEEPQWFTATPIVQTQPEEPPQPYYPPANPYDPPQYAPADPYYPYPYPVQPVPTAIPYTAPIDEPDAIRDTGASLGFTYTLTEMSRDNIPMTWQYTGMVQYSINYLDAGGNLYPAFAMEWTPAGDLCSGVVCKASVRNIPDELLKGGTFSLQLRAQDTEGRTVISDPITMQVSIPASTATPIPTPEPEHHSVFGGFLRWLFGPIIRLFGGK